MQISVFNASLLYRASSRIQVRLQIYRDLSTETKNKTTQKTKLVMVVLHGFNPSRGSLVYTARAPRSSMLK